ncbi:DUF6624 domain-containing protein [Streptomyces goshikiensis]|uniref:DUF6624 domain-containing protein n=1 Tax=Streptomyces goshikiensis TaxID=1942 RepID=UPI0036A2BD85
MFARFADGWRLGVIAQPHLGGHLPGGYVEHGETTVEAAEREAAQESGRSVHLVPRPLQAELPADYPHPQVSSSGSELETWWAMSTPAAPDSRCAREHLHLDHLHVGFALRPFHVITPPEHPFRWVAPRDLPGLGLARDTQVMGTYLFSLVPELARGLQPAGDTEPELRLALLERMKHDQAVRTAGPDVRATPEHREKWRAVDEANTAWVKDLLAARRAFPGDSVIGSDGVQALWLLVQHADHDRELQARCADLLGRTVTAGEADPQHLALLEDRLACAAGQPQWFGSQFYREPGGPLEPAPLREPTHVDEFRSWVGLNSLKDYADQLTGLS